MGAFPCLIPPVVSGGEIFSDLLFSSVDNQGKNSFSLTDLELTPFETGGKKKKIQSNFNGSNTFGTVKISLRQG